MAFSFGQNWLQFSRIIDEQRIAEAEANVRRLTGAEALHGRSFIDVGAGSGLFSIAAARLGAASVIAIDRDTQCLQAIRNNVTRFLPPQRAGCVHIQFGDILDANSVRGLQADVVYAWGSLHHTGAMWA